MFRLPFLLKGVPRHIKYKQLRFKSLGISGISGNVAVRFLLQSSRRVLTTSRNFPLKRIGGTIAIGILCSAGGDVVQQVLIEKQKPSIRRSLGFGLMGIVFGGGAYFGYTWMHSMAFFSSYALRQALVFQIFFSPPFYLLFYTMTGYIEGESTAQIKDEISKKFLLTYMTDCCVYFPFVILNVKYIPVHLRASADCTVMFLWFAFLSYLKHLKMEQSKDLETILLHKSD